MEARAELEQRRQAAAHRQLPGGPEDAGEQLQERGFAGAVGADHADDSPGATVKETSTRAGTARPARSAPLLSPRAAPTSGSRPALPPVAPVELRHVLDRNRRRPVPRRPVASHASSAIESRRLSKTTAAAASERAAIPAIQAHSAAANGRKKKSAHEEPRRTSRRDSRAGRPRKLSGTAPPGKERASGRTRASGRWPRDRGCHRSARRATRRQGEAEDGGASSGARRETGAAGPGRGASSPSLVRMAAAAPEAPGRDARGARLRHARERPPAPRSSSAAAGRWRGTSRPRPRAPPRRSPRRARPRRGRAHKAGRRRGA